MAQPLLGDELGGQHGYVQEVEWDRHVHGVRAVRQRHLRSHRRADGHAVPVQHLRQLLRFDPERGNLSGCRHADVHRRQHRHQRGRHHPEWRFGADCQSVERERPLRLSHQRFGRDAHPHERSQPDHVRRVQQCRGVECGFEQHLYGRRGLHADRGEHHAGEWHAYGRHGGYSRGNAQRGRYRKRLGD